MTLVKKISAIAIIAAISVSSDGKKKEAEVNSRAVLNPDYSTYVVLI